MREVPHTIGAGTMQGPFLFWFNAPHALSSRRLLTYCKLWQPESPKNAVQAGSGEIAMPRVEIALQEVPDPYWDSTQRRTFCGPLALPRLASQNREFWLSFEGQDGFLAGLPRAAPSCVSFPWRREARGCLSRRSGVRRQRCSPFPLFWVGIRSGGRM